MSKKPFMTAHTGCMGTPLNSLQSALEAIAAGADIVEDDIRLTRDGVLVLAHDDEVRLQDGSIGSISQLTLADVKRVAFVTELEPVLKLVTAAGKRMNLDLKADACIEPAAELARRLGALDQVFFSGCEYDRAMKAQTLVPEIQKLLNTDFQLFRDHTYDDAVTVTCEQAIRAGCFGINIHYSLVTTSLVDRANEYNLPVYVWTVDERDDMRRLAAMGVRSITTKDVVSLSEVLSQAAETGG